MKKTLTRLSVLCFLLCAHDESHAQITVVKDYQNNTSATIGTYQGITVREAGFSSLRYIPGTEGKEFWTCSDRGPNVDAASANPGGCTPTYDKIFPFPNYAPKLHRIRINGDSIQILRTITVKRASGTNATGIMNPTGLGSTSVEVASTDTVLNCANFNSKVATKDTFGLDCEGIAVDKNGNFWLCEEGGPTIWKLDQNGKVIKRYTPYFNLPGVQAVDAPIDTVFKYRKNNRGFENLTIAPNGKIYVLIQSPLLFPTQTVGENTRIHRILELDPSNGNMRMLAYLNDGIIGPSGSNQIRLRDWKIGDITAINDSTFLVLEAAARGTTDIKRMYMININGATAVTSGLYGGLTLEALVDSTGLAGQNIKAVKKTLFMDLLANGWPAAYDKAEGLTIINDSTIAICNDNDYGLSSPAANGIITATGTLSHLVVYRLSGANKLTNFVPLIPTLSEGISGLGSSQPPYLVPTIPGAWYKAIISAGDKSGSYTMCGTPDGLGAFDNGNGTFTVVMNHEFGNTSGIARAHGSTGAFVSKWVINKSDLSVVSGGDLMQKVNLWNTLTSSYVAYTPSFPSTLTSFGRFCSADLPAVSAFYNSATGKGTQERIFMNGEESGTEGRGMAHIITGANGGTSYELPALGKFSWENSVACPYASDSTIVVGTDDATPGQVYVYVGAKTTSGNEIERAGLTNGKLYGIKVSGLTTEVSGSVPAANTAFTLASLGNVTNLTGATIETNSNNAGITRFLRPEDAAWDPANPNDLYFATTNAFGSPSRLWKVHFSNIATPSAGGTITAVLDGTEGQQMLDNIGIDNYGHVMMVEDVGGNAHIGKIWQYTIETDNLQQVGWHDSTRFLNGSANFLTQDEEASGIIDVQGILGAGMFLTVDQAHYGISGEIVEGGQLLAFYNPATAASNPEVALEGNSVVIVDGDVTPSTADNTDFGNVNKGVAVNKTYTLKNAGPGPLTINGINLSNNTTGAFSLVSPLNFPITVAANGTQNITIQFLPPSLNGHTAMLNVVNNDFDENIYNVAVSGIGVTPDINLQGNGITIMDGDATAGLANNTDFGGVNVGSNTTKTFNIQNTGSGTLTVTGISFTGINAGDFTLSGAPSFPMTIASSGSQAVTVQFAPGAIGARMATLNVANDDIDEGTYDFAIQGQGVDPTSIASPSSASLIKLFPNPTGEAATISMMLKKDEHIAISVADIQGKQVIAAINKNFKAGEQTVVISTANLQNGVYFVQIAAGGQVSKVKMVVSH